MSPPTAVLDELPCGTRLDDLIEQVADGRGAVLTEHQLGCTHCQAALTEIARLWAPLTALASERVDIPTDLAAKIMELVRDLALEVWHIVLPGERGSTRVAARVIATIARRAAARTAGVRVVLGRSSQARLAASTEIATRSHQQPGSAVGIAGQHAVIDLAVVATYGLSLPRIADEIRENVQSDLRTLAAIQDVEVNIHLDDIISGG